LLSLCLWRRARLPRLWEQLSRLILYAYLFNCTRYNEYRHHDSLGGVPPKQFMLRLIATTAADSRNQQSA